MLLKKKIEKYRCETRQKTRRENLNLVPARETRPGKLAKKVVNARRWSV